WQYLPLRRVSSNYQCHPRRSPSSAEQMKEHNFSELNLEPERYELQAAPTYRFDLDRREFFKVLGCGVVVLLFIEAALAQESGGRRGSGRGTVRPMEIGAWLHIGEDGVISVFTGKTEVGQ